MSINTLVGRFGGFAGVGGVQGWVKIVLLGESETFSPGAPAPALDYMQGGTTEYVMDLKNIADQTLSIKTTPAAAGGPGLIGLRRHHWSRRCRIRRGGPQGRRRHPSPSRRRASSWPP